ncbi:MAG: heavy-metal-associated domain-containing protein [Flavobacteriales bacterium]|nr:heavy-metal-associated domain-containing protein [Flavobacteriales bacterium]
MRTLLALSLVLASSLAFAQDKKAVETLTVRTSTVCDMCVKTIEENLIYEKGVKKVKVDLTTNTIAVDYDPRKTGPDAIRKGIVKLGYYADDLPGDPEAFRNLPACCQKEGCGQPAEKH